MGFRNIDLQEEFPKSITIEALFEKLSKRFGPVFSREVYDHESMEFNKNFSVAVNGLLMEYIEAGKTPLDDGANIFVFPVYTGG